MVNFKTVRSRITSSVNFVRVQIRAIGFPASSVRQQNKFSTNAVNNKSKRSIQTTTISAVFERLIIQKPSVIINLSQMISQMQT
jgi:hypothetical protein